MAAAGADRPPAVITKTADPVSTANLAEYTFSTVALGDAAADRQIIVHVGTNASGSADVTALTVGGVSASPVVAVTDGALGNVRSELWIAAVPTGTTGDIVVTLDATATLCGIVVSRMVDHQSATAVTTYSDGSVSANALSVSINASAGSGAVTGACGGGGAALRTATWAGVTDGEVDEVVEGTVGHYATHANFAAAQSGLTVSCTFNDSLTAAAMTAAVWR